MGGTIKTLKKVNETYDFLDDKSTIVMKTVLSNLIQSGKPSYVGKEGDEFDMDYYSLCDNKKYLMNIIGSPGATSKIMAIYCDGVGHDDSFEVVGEDHCKIFLGDIYQVVIQIIINNLPK